ncbi:lipoprotein [Pandoraea captiosa]|uniref:Lipoprotein n=1 Tax=Pandoraea captiosa TaxID=2508302 RepID=A0A5E4ZV19_9BURK|nr:DUF6726 family protein [Pandoraea captiosa]VVE64125.1 lipoprotein [Pandoraea captiosa]
MNTLSTMRGKAIATTHATTRATMHAANAAPTDEHDPRAHSGKAEREPSVSTPAPRHWRRWWAVFAILPFVTSVAGCGLLAAPCRVASAGLKIIPGVGGVLATPTDACAAAID